MENREEHLARVFLDQSRRFLLDDYHPKILRSLQKLSDEEIWWRPNEASNSIGNLLLHLAGNASQWIVSGIGGAPDTRNRPAEFDDQLRRGKAELLSALDDTLHQVDLVLSRLDASQLFETRVIQGQPVRVLDAVYHVVEHFSMHTGQIIYITKLCSGSSMDFYEFEEDGMAKPTWREKGLI